MTVAQLREQLEKYPDWMEVWIDTDNVKICLQPTWMDEDEKDREYKRLRCQKISTIQREPWSHEDRVTISIEG